MRNTGNLKAKAYQVPRAWLMLVVAFFSWALVIAAFASATNSFAFLLG